MKFAFFGFDFFVAAARRLVEDGHQLTAVFTIKADNIYNFNQQTLELGATAHVPVKLSKPTRSDIEQLEKQGTELILVMGYDHRVPVPSRAKALNLHPTLLPQGRGVWPLPYLITHAPHAAGLTIHKLSDELDAGDILLQEPVDLDETDSLETLSAKLQMKASGFVSRAVNDLTTLWEEATRQGAESSTWPMPDDDERVLPWAGGVAAVMRLVRGFGKFESTAVLDGSEWMVTDAQAWAEAHSYVPGTIVHRMGREVVVAASDGFVLLRHFHRELDLRQP